jgi:hypothetical protein
VNRRRLAGARIDISKKDVALVSPSARIWNTRLQARTRAASPIRSSTAAAG